MKPVLLLILSFLTPLLSAQQERILSFDTKIEVHSDASLDITENIKVNAQGNQIKRGIYRVLPMTRKKNTGTFPVNYQVKSVLRDGKEEPYHTQEKQGLYYIYIGDSGVYLQEGEHTYTIHYSTDKQIGYFEEYDEIYWNVTGNYWQFPIEKASATVQLPEGVKPFSVDCYTGSYGSSASKCESFLETNATIAFKAQSLPPQEGLTISVAFPKGVVALPPTPTFWEQYGVAILSGILFFPLLFYYYRRWNSFGRDYQKPTVYPQFSPPRDLSPASVGYLENLGMNNNLFTATVVNLAIKGYLRIEEKKQRGLLSTTITYILHQLKTPDESLPQEEYTLLKELFKYESIKKIGGGYDPDVENALLNFKAALRVQYDKIINEGMNLKYTLFPLLLIFVLFLLNGFNLSQLEQYYGELEPFLVMNIALLVVGIMLFVFLFIIKKFRTKAMLVLFFSVITIVFFAYNAISSQNLTPIYLTLAILSGLLCVFLYYTILIARPSLYLVETQSLIQGLKMYLTYAEEKQLQHFNPPTLTPAVFEKMLPYAIVLGVDNLWGDKFQRLVEAGVIPENYEPIWFMGNYANMSMFTSSLAYNMNNQISSAAAPPPSSGSLGSGSFGGGFSGGGGGGGGGGGW